MKKVVVAITNVCLVSDATPDKYYGVQVGETRGFIARSGYFSGKYSAHCMRGLTRANFWNDFDRDSLSATMKALIEAGQGVFEFDTPEDLMRWVLGD